jgi:hypothetical protein
MPVEVVFGFRWLHLSENLWKNGLIIIIILGLLYGEHFMHITAVFILGDLGSVILTSAILKSPQQVTHVGSFACPGTDTRVQGISVLRLVQRMRQSEVK